MNRWMRTLLRNLAPLLWVATVAVSIRHTTDHLGPALGFMALAGTILGYYDERDGDRGLADAARELADTTRRSGQTRPALRQVRQR